MLEGYFLSNCPRCNGREEDPHDCLHIWHETRRKWYKIVQHDGGMYDFLNPKGIPI